MNELIPTISGRNYRILPWSKDHLYDLYCSMDPEPVSKSYFLNMVLKPNNFHNTNVVDICPYCSGSMPLSRKGSIDGIETHKMNGIIQLRSYLKDKQRVSEAMGILLLVQDFTQVTFANNFAKTSSYLFISIL